MAFGNTKYPNLELMEYKFRQILNKNEKWISKIRAYKEKNPSTARYVLPEFDITVFSQVWGSTITAYDVCPDGSPAIGGCAMTKAYTVVIEEKLTRTFGVFVDDQFCYIVLDPSDAFYEDLKNHDIASISRAKKSY